MDPCSRILKRVSIHASAREATADLTILRTRLSVSIHASAREATPAAEEAAALMKVSIHASAREATWRSRSVADGREFQSTPPRERRRIASVKEVEIGRRSGASSVRRPLLGIER